MAATPGKPPAKLAPFPAVTGLKRFLAGAIGAAWLGLSLVS